MVTALKTHEPGPMRLVLIAPVLIGHLQGDLHRRAAIVGKEGPAAGPGRRTRSNSARATADGWGDTGEVYVVERSGSLVQRGGGAADADARGGSSTRRKCRRSPPPIGQKQELVFGGNGHQRKVGIL